jgi:hypothetical protein
MSRGGSTLSQPLVGRINIGCGNDSWGDIRIDIHRTRTTNIVASAEDLPFRDDSFGETRMWHVLEHSKNPQLALSEALRVSKHVHAKFPYKYDRVPFVLATLLSFHTRGLGDPIHHFLSQIGIEEHPMRHRWLVQPFGTYRLNKICIFPPPLFLSGRKKRFFRHVPRIFIGAEWECFT